MTSPFETPSFRRENLSRDAPQKDGDAFQQFVFEALHRKHKDLYRYPTGGKDGGIDLVRPEGRPTWLFECKYVGEDGRKAARKAWREVAKKLRENLESPEGPPSGQSQYQPFFETDPAARVYVFCISSQLGNLAQRIELLREIRSFFAGIAAEHPHLAHLRGLRALVLDDGSWKSLLADQPDLVFKWFATVRPAGLVPLDSQPGSSRSFRRFLTEGRLPFYSRREHLEHSPPPPDVSIPDEEGLLRILFEGDSTGLVITGGGGYGKTRLMLELGRLAASKDWLVCQLQGAYVSGTLERLADRLHPDSPALLLIDYLETQPTFVDLIETLNLLVDERRLPLRYIACCRTTYYPSVQVLGRIFYLESHLLRSELLNEVVATLKEVVGSLLLQQRLHPAGAALIAAILSITGRRRELRRATLDLFLRWIRHTSACGFSTLRPDGSVSRLQRTIESGGLLDYLRDLFEARSIRFPDDVDSLRRFFAWVEQWSEEGRSKVAAEMKALRDSIVGTEGDR